RNGTQDLLRRMDEVAEAHLEAPGENTWHPPSTSELRAAQREADRIIAAAVAMPERPDTLTAHLDAVLLHPAAGLAILLALLFVMFQAVFSWARPVLDLMQAVFGSVGLLPLHLPTGGQLPQFVPNCLVLSHGCVLVV